VQMLVSCSISACGGRAIILALFICDGERNPHDLLLANLLQRSKTTCSCAGFSSFIAFKAGMGETKISALPGWPTVSPPLRHTQKSTLLFLALNRHGWSEHQEARMVLHNLHAVTGVLIRHRSSVQHDVVYVIPLLMPRRAKNPENGITTSTARHLPERQRLI
jgi:hypothetical protein